ncbi:MAG: HEAT repeat domain-containing protein, partial [Pirellula sp.]|nr:HEAT repeat domain-containing protein [Pirellula sp.]
DPACIGKLNQALDLKHRRIRTEAAFALGKLGEQHGIDALVEMAIDPAVRTRVIAYAEELGCIDKIDEQYRGISVGAVACPS